MMLPIFIRLLVYLLVGVVLLQASTLMSQIRWAIVSLAGVFFILCLAALIKALIPNAAHDSFIDFAMTPYLIIVLVIWIRAWVKISLLPMREPRREIPQRDLIEHSWALHK